MSEGKKVLVVEDYDDSREFLRFLLELSGFNVIVAKDGIEALRMVDEQEPDLILMDISMPFMDGLTATRKIRQQKQFQNTPIIAVTAHGEAHYSKVIEAGCNDLVNKPLDFDELTPKLNKYLAPVH